MACISDIGPAVERPPTLDSDIGAAVERLPALISDIGEAVERPTDRNSPACSFMQQPPALVSLIAPVFVCKYNQNRPPWQKIAIITARI